MNVFAHEIRQYRKGLLGWIIGLCLGAFMFMPFLPAFAENVTNMKEFLSSMGQMAIAVGIDLDLFFGPLGYFNYIFSFIILAAGIQALALGLKIIAAEGRFKTADFLLTKPMSRTAIYLQKVLAGFVSLLITQVTIYAVCLISLMFFTPESFSVPSFLLLASTLGFTQFFLYALGIFIATLIPKLKQTIGIAIGLTIVFYMFSMIANVTEISELNWLTPFKYFEGNYLLSNQAYDVLPFALGLSLTALFIFLGLLVYRRRDVDSV